MKQSKHIGTDAETKPKKVQMTDIARLAGVSASTVSRALKDSPLIPDETKSRIQELAKSLHYSVNVGAANLRSKTVNTVALVHLGDNLQRISDPFLLSMVGHIADELEALGMSLLLTKFDVEKQEQLPAMVGGGQVAGLIVVGQLGWHHYLNELARRQVPIVVWGAAMPDAEYRQVGTDNLKGGYMATKHLIDVGCSRIAFVGDVNYPEGRMRYDGYKRALIDAGLVVDPVLFHPFLFGEASTRAAVEQWMSTGHDFDGVFAASDVAAINVLSALNGRGKRVPNDVKLVGYDDIPMASYLHPSLTTVRQSTEEAAKNLVKLLNEALAGRPRRSVMLETKLVVRESTGR
jgi:DNA-binding LacI/PurR family transcriptional regulator